MTNNTITLTDEQMVELQSGKAITIETPKPKRWEPRGGVYSIYGSGEVSEHKASLNAYRLSGSERDTREAAERAAKLITRYKRLLAYVDEHRREGEVDECVLYFDGVAWIICHPNKGGLGAVTMPRRVAYQLAQDLESGVFVYE
jgi:hypothetical protein